MSSESERERESYWRARAKWIGGVAAQLRELLYSYVQFCYKHESGRALCSPEQRDTRLALTIACRIDYTHFFAFFGGRGLPSNRSLS